MQTTVRMSRRWGVTAGAGSLLLLAACDHPSPIPADVALSISGERILYRQFEASLRDATDRENPPFEADVQSRLFDQFVDGQLLIRLAIERGLEIDAGYGGALAPADPNPEGTAGIEPGGGLSGDLHGAAERRAIRFLLRGSETWAASPEEVAAYYEENRDQFQRPAEVYLRQILVQERQQAETALAAIAAGEDFVEVAARFSQGPKAHQGGDQGRLAAEDLPQDFRETIFALEPGEVSDVVAAYYGFLIFQVVERFPARQASLADVEEEIQQILHRRHLDDLVRTFILEARARYNVEIFPENFPFRYQGAYAKPTNE